MKIFLDVRNFDFKKLEIKNYFKSIKENFPKSQIFINKDSNFKTDLINLFELKTGEENCEICIYFKNDNFKTELNFQKFKFIFYFDINYPWWSYRLRTDDDESHKLLDPDHDHTVFGRLGKRNSDEIFYFPYSFLFRCSGLGPIDKYGFRKKNIQEEAYNIMILGGSACWGYNVLQSESFPELLQAKLNKFIPDKNVVIYNFAQHSYLLNDQFIAFLLHYHKIKPKMVIMHDGFNDLQFGMITDQNMIKDKITYALTHEYVSNKINTKSSSVLTHGDSEKMSVLNTPIDVIDSYYSQKKIIKTMIESLGIKFFSSLQPFLYSKTKLSEYEKNYLNKYDIANSTYGEPYNACKFLYDKISSDKYFFDINFHKEFNTLDENLFIDFCHLNKDGEKVLSEIYFEFIKDRI